jgi:predicted lactoylglutathione lyase/uncharacterized protein YndB with AHSA1/START domain
MPTKEIWINLPVKDVAKSIEFYKAIGFILNTAHGNAIDSACFLIGEKNMVLMLFQEDVFKSFTKNNLTDTGQSSEVLISLDSETKNEVDEIANKAESAGGNVFSKPEEIQGWMYGCGFTDVDGHRWNMLHMDMSKNPHFVSDTKECILVHTTVNATAKKVWEYFTLPEHITKWNNASYDWHTVNATNDLKVGGKFLSRMEAKNGSMGFNFEGHYTHIETEEDIAYTLMDSRKVNIHFEKVPDGIKITESFEPETQNSPELQKQGWQSILNNFKTYTENN